MYYNIYENNVVRVAIHNSIINEYLNALTRRRIMYSVRGANIFCRKNNV